MDSATLSGCRAKVKRCEELLPALADKWRAFLDREPWPSGIEHREETGWYEVYFDFSAPAPPVLAVIVGEIAHNLRSALDTLVWREAVEFLGREPTNDESRGIKFPFCWQESEWRGSKIRGYVSKDAAALIKRHQPYNCTKHGEPASLLAVQWFNNRDKHRAIQVTFAAAPRRFSLEQVFIAKNKLAEIEAVQPHLAPGQRLEGKTKVVSVRFKPGPEPYVTVESPPPVNPSFGQLPAKLAGAEVKTSVAKVIEIVNDFADLIP